MNICLLHLWNQTMDGYFEILDNGREYFLTSVIIICIILYDILTLIIVYDM